MNRELAHKWDERYRAALIEDYLPAEVLRDNAHLLPVTGEALDLACGLGPNALFLARGGLRVSALDISPLAVARLNRYAADAGLAVQASAVDLTEHALPVAAFEVVVVARYLERPLAPALCRALKPGGLLFYQTFTNERRGAGPSNPDFLLEPGELLRLFAPLRPVYYREDGWLGDPQRGLRGEALLVGMAAA